ncbi:MAG: HAD family hydrolase [Bdellovibrionales bacterium]
MPLHKVISDIKDKNGPILCVFDLDSTLFDVSPRSQFILRQFAAEPHLSAQFPEEAEILGKIEVHSRDWGIKQALQRHNVKSTVEFFDTVRKYWIEKLFSSEFLHLDTPYEGAIEYVNELHRLGAKIHYLTGRDAPRMEEGTRRSLSQHGFPLDEEHLLILKPETQMNDAEFKVQVFQEYVNNYKDIWLFENEPVNINLIQGQFPQVKIIFMDSTHSGRETINSNVHTISLKFPFNR